MTERFKEQSCILVAEFSLGTCQKEGGPGKLRPSWEEKVHLVVKRKASESQVYEVQPEDGQGCTRVLHRNLLFPCDFLPVESHKPGKIRGERTHKEKNTLLTYLWFI